MPNPTPAKYTKQLGPMVTPEMAAELEANAREDGISVSTLTRQMIETMLEMRRPAREAIRTPAQQKAWKRSYDAALAKTAAQGAQHVQRHRASDAALRGGGGRGVTRATAGPSTIDN